MSFNFEWSLTRQKCNQILSQIYHWDLFHCIASDKRQRRSHYGPKGFEFAHYFIPYGSYQFFNSMVRPLWHMQHSYSSKIFNIWWEAPEIDTVNKSHSSIKIRTPASSTRSYPFTSISIQSKVYLGLIYPKLGSCPTLSIKELAMHTK